MSITDEWQHKALAGFDARFILNRHRCSSSCVLAPEVELQAQGSHGLSNLYGLIVAVSSDK